MNIIDNKLEFNSNISKIGNVDTIVLHHSGVTVLQSIETIHNYHKNTNGWAGIGYHYYVRKDGSIYKGRDEKYAGAHCLGKNSTSIGICAEGDFEQEQMSEVQKNAIIELIADIKTRYNIKEIGGHKDYIATTCPGVNFPLEEIKKGKISVENNEVTTEKAQGKIANIQSTLNSRYGLNIAVDNIYGTETKSALVKGLQTELNKQFNRGLAVDGIFGTKTKSACVNVRKGAEGNITYIIQATLVCKGFNIDVDGIFGTATENAVKEFQTRNNLSADGIVGPLTWEKLYK